MQDEAQDEATKAVHTKTFWTWKPSRSKTLRASIPTLELINAERDHISFKDTQRKV